MSTDSQKRTLKGGYYGSLERATEVTWGVQDWPRVRAPIRGFCTLRRVREPRMDATINVRVTL